MWSCSKDGNAPLCKSGMRGFEFPHDLRYTNDAGECAIKGYPANGSFFAVDLGKITVI